MKLPFNAYIDPRKLRDYLLLHRRRNDKSRWLSKAGFRRSNWQQLEHDLRNQILPKEAELVERNQFGLLFEIKSELIGPNGKKLWVRTIWMREYASNMVKFITMFPAKERKQA